ncbi:MAG: 2OG-Fe(II) oxygenase [Alcaligenaceae bacterium]|nr:2OG-Fe(II) oxygenase [Alcaligenaceae bacterium]
MQSIDKLLSALENKGWFISDDLFPADLIHQLFLEGQQRWEQGQFHDARVGRKQHLAQAAHIRGDSILWLDANDEYPATQEIFKLTGLMQEAFNRYFFLGLKHAELHYARYASGAAYTRHLDQHKNTSARKITLVSYLNPDWKQADGGELVLYDPLNPSQELQRILPLAGRTVIFRSELIEHEVLPCKKPRWSVTGWFRDDEIMFDIAA